MTREMKYGIKKAPAQRHKILHWMLALRVNNNSSRASHKSQNHKYKSEQLTLSCYNLLLIYLIQKKKIIDW